MKKYVNKLFVPLALIYMLFTGVLLVYNDYTLSALMPLAPIIYGMMFVVMYQRRNSAFESFVVIFIYAIWFLRLVVNPCLLVLSGYESNIITSAGTDNLDFAVLLVAYEFLASTVYLLITRRIKRIASSEVVMIRNDVTKTRQIVSWIVLALAAFACLAVLLDRSVLVTISTVFTKIAGNADSALERRRELIRLRSNTSLAFHLFANCVFYLQILIPASVLSRIMTQRRNGGRQKGYWFSIIVALSAVLITTDNNSNSVCILLAAMLVVFFNYREKMDKKILRYAAGIAAFVLIFLLSKVNSGSSDGIAFAGISRLFNAYFVGFPNVSAGFSVVFEDKAATFFGDIVSGVPYMMAVFKGYPKSVTLFNEAIYGYSGITNQIMPLITNGYHYLGLFAPAFTISIYAIALNMEERARKSQQILNQVIYALIAVNLSIAPCMYGFSSHIKRLSMFIPLLILARINRQITRN